MFKTFGEFMICLRDARFGFGVIAAAIASLYNAIITNPDMISIWTWLNGIYHSASMIFRFVFLFGALLIVFFGKKFIGAVKFCFFFVIGFALGAHLLTPVFPDALGIPAWLVGIVIGVVSAVLYRIIYYILYSVVLGYGTYILIFNGFYISKSPVNYSFARLLMGIIVALGVIVVAFIFRKYIEIAITALFGGWLATKVLVHCFYNYIAAWQFLAGKEWIGIFVPMMIFAIAGFVVQFITRRRW